MSDSKYTLFSSSIRVKAPTTWTDEQAETLMPELEQRLQDGLDGVAATIRAAHDALEVTVDV